MTRPGFSARTALMVSAALFALSIGSAATAQDQVQQAPAQDDQSAGDAEGDELIIITAQKREEILQDVPISISVVSGEQLQQSGATQLVDFGGYIPGLQVDSLGTPGQVTISLRGVAPVGPSATVGTYLDDAPVGSSSLYARSVAFTLDLLPYDIERIEVLRGPQGTLYGASSIGGLLKYVTVSPNLHAVSARMGVEAFDIAHGGGLGYAGQAQVGVPLVAGSLAATGSLAYRKSPGFVDNVETGAKDQNEYDQIGGRVSLLWKPSDRFTAKLSGLWQKIDSDDNANVTEDLATGERIGDGLSNNNFIDEPFRKTLQYYSATLDYDVGFATLTSASSYSHSKVLQVQDASRVFGVLFPLFGAPAGLSPFELRLKLDKYTQEFRLTSPSGGQLEWMLGSFYTYEKSRNAQIAHSLFFDGTPIPGLDPLATAELPSKYREYAVFGAATYKLSSFFDVTGGLRWARNKQRFRQISSGAILPTADDPGRSSESVVTYSFSPRIHLNEDTMIYGRVASGYRPGGPNVTLPGVAPTVGSDSLVNYEVGFKSNLAGPRLSIELAAFYMDWKDIQLSVDFNGVSGLSNAGSASSQGIEGSLLWRPIPGLRLGANGAFVDAKLTSTPPPSVGGQDGDRLPNIPRWSGSLTADYSFDVSARSSARLGVGLRHTGRRISLVESNPNSVPAKAYTALDLNAEVTFDRNWAFRLYGRNVTDSEGDVTRSLATDGLGRPYQFSVTPLQPRTIGIAAEYAF